MQDRKAPPAARGAAAQALLDRAWGKPAQHVEQEQPETLKIVIKKFVPAPGAGMRELPGEEEMTAESMPAPMRRDLLGRIDAELERRGEVTEAPFKRLDGPSSG